MSDTRTSLQTQAMQCHEACMETYKACTLAIPYCIQAGGDLARPERLQALYDCADINLAAANFVARSSPHHRELFRLSKTVSEACAASIQDVEHGNGLLRSVYAACQRVVQACRALTEGDLTGAEAKRDEALRETFPASDPTPTPTEL